MHPIYYDIYFVLPSAFDILRFILSCRAIAIYDMPINLRYIYKRVSPLLITNFSSLSISGHTYRNVIAYWYKYPKIQKGKCSGEFVHFWVGFAGNSIKKRGFARFEKGSAPLFLCCSKSEKATFSSNQKTHFGIFHFFSEEK